MNKIAKTPDVLVLSAGTTKGPQTTHPFFPLPPLLDGLTVQVFYRVLFLWGEVSIFEGDRLATRHGVVLAPELGALAQMPRHLPASSVELLLESLGFRDYHYLISRQSK